MEKICIYCGISADMMMGKKYCVTCYDNMYKECIRCHRPYHSIHYFTLSIDRCNSCQQKYEKEKIRNKSKCLSSKSDTEKKNKKKVTNGKTKTNFKLDINSEVCAKKSRKQTSEDIGLKKKKKLTDKKKKEMEVKTSEDLSPKSEGQEDNTLPCIIEEETSSTLMNGTVRQQPTGFVIKIIYANTDITPPTTKTTEIVI